MADNGCCTKRKDIRQSNGPVLAVKIAHTTPPHVLRPSRAVRCLNACPGFLASWFYLYTFLFSVLIFLVCVVREIWNFAPLQDYMHVYFYYTYTIGTRTTYFASSPASHLYYT